MLVLVFLSGISVPVLRALSWYRFGVSCGFVACAFSKLFSCSLTKNAEPLLGVVCVCANGVDMREIELSIGLVELESDASMTCEED